MVRAPSTSASHACTIGRLLPVGVQRPVHQQVADALARVPVAELGLALHPDESEAPLRGDLRSGEVASGPAAPDRQG